jgi:hypothetical protein
MLLSQTVVRLDAAVLAGSGTVNFSSSFHSKKNSQGLCQYKKSQAIEQLSLIACPKNSEIGQFSA